LKFKNKNDFIENKPRMITRHGKIYGFHRINCYV